MPGKLFYKNQQIPTPTLGGENALAMYLGTKYVGYDGRFMNSISASGGDITITDDFIVHAFNYTGSITNYEVNVQNYNFNINKLSNYDNVVNYVIIGGGGGAYGTLQNNGGGGAGGLVVTGSFIATTGTYPIEVGRGGYFFTTSNTVDSGRGSKLTNPQSIIIASASGGGFGGSQQQPPYFDGRGGSNDLYTGGGSPVGGGAGAAGNGTAGGATTTGQPGAGVTLNLPIGTRLFGNGGLGSYPSSSIGYDSGSGGNSSGGFTYGNGPANGGRGLVLIYYYRNPLQV
jgi:hypothetical protein